MKYRSVKKGRCVVGEVIALTFGRIFIVKCAIYFIFDLKIDKCD